jgi:hypothetical protein
MNPARFHVTLTLEGRPTLHGWWGSEPIARSQFLALVGRYGQPGAHITLMDEETGETLTEWPEAS